MSVTGFVRSQVRRVTVPRLQRRILSQAGPERLGAPDWQGSLRDPTAFYLDCYRFFHQRLPKELREHRAYFCQERRGFNEDPMHVMWWMLFQEFKPANFLEIGVYRGQTISLAALLGRQSGLDCEVHGISPFTPAGDAVSKYCENVDYLRDTRTHFAHFGLPQASLLKAFSTDAEAVALIRSKTWDMIYIDGNHDYDVAKHDWDVCSQSAKSGGMIVLDDSALQTSYRPPVFATAGHPGPSRVAREIDQKEFREILQVGHNRVFQKAG